MRIRINPPKTPVRESNNRESCSNKKNKGKRKKGKERSIEEITEEEKKSEPSSNKAMQPLIFTSYSRLAPGSERPTTNSISTFVPPPTPKPPKCMFVRNEWNLLKTQDLKTQKRPRPKNKGKKNCITGAINNQISGRLIIRFFAIELREVKFCLTIILLHSIECFFNFVEA